MKRLDVALVEMGVAPSRTKAQELISGGEVEVRYKGQWNTADQASLKVAQEDIRVRPDAAALRYVSRGGLKLEAALDHLRLDVKGMRCLDLGLSTGGFTDCLLQRGATAVCGIDVGHGQLHPKLAGDPRVTSFEGVNVKDLARHEGFRAWGGAALAVADLSFISFVRILPDIAGVLPRRVLALIKPQFEVGPENLDGRGIADPQLFDDVKGRTLLAFQKCGFSVADYFASSVKGQDGNQEFFVHAHRP